jgi:hypothetical protein
MSSDLVGRGHIPEATLQYLVIGISEATRSAVLHGLPPLTVCI